jgi:hypothetical protein
VILDGDSYRAPRPLPDAPNLRSENAQKSTLAKGVRNT